MVNEGLDGNAGSLETGFAAHPLRIDPDKFIKLGLLFRGHGFRVRESALVVQAEGRTLGPRPEGLLRFLRPEG